MVVRFVTPRDVANVCPVLCDPAGIQMEFMCLLQVQSNKMHVNRIVASQMPGLFVGKHVMATPQGHTCQSDSRLRGRKWPTSIFVLVSVTFTCSQEKVHVRKCCPWNARSQTNIFCLVQHHSFSAKIKTKKITQAKQRIWDRSHQRGWPLEQNGQTATDGRRDWRAAQTSVSPEQKTETRILRTKRRFFAQEAGATSAHQRQLQATQKWRASQVF